MQIRSMPLLASYLATFPIEVNIVCMYVLYVYTYMIVCMYACMHVCM